MIQLAKPGGAGGVLLNSGRIAEHRSYIGSVVHMFKKRITYHAHTLFIYLRLKFYKRK